MASALLSPLCKRLGDIASQEYELVRDVKEEVGKLILTVSLIKKFLKDAEQKQVKEEDVRDWLRSLKQLLYDAEDILDEAATDSALETRRVEDVTSWSVCLNAIFGCGSIDEFLSRRHLARQIKQINMKLEYTCKRKDALGLKELITSENISQERRRLDTSSVLKAEKPCIVGRDDEKRKIMGMLMGSELETSTSEPTSSNSNNVHVLSLVGMGGLGKTTLAQLVFNDPTVKQHFHVMIWVCVSENFDVKRITKEILEVISGPTYQLNWDSAQRSLKDKIEGKKFLLVLDDVWEVDLSNWENLCEPLTYGGKGSRIIVTTRNQKVFVKASCVLLKSLLDQDLWPILKSYAFDGGSTSHGHVQLLESIGRQMVKKLKGSPLAAKTIGRLLNRSLDVRHWQNILDSEISTLEQDPNDILPVLKLSYDHLPGHLKQCFAYCSLFPKDYVFSGSELAQHWVAQNFIPATRSDQHLDDLLDMSFFEKNIRYVMHDLIHDLAESISEGDCLRLEDGVPPNKSPEAIRHVSIVTEQLDPMRLEELCKYGKLRTLHFVRGWTVDLSPPRFKLSPLILDNLLTKLKRLRVLGLSHCRISELPSSIGNLKHLRFLDLSWTDIIELPESLCGLHNLQVLKLRDYRGLRALPGNNMSALVNLTHMEVDYPSGHLFDCIQGLGKMTALQEVDVRGVKAKELGDMSMLRRLRIRNLEEVTGREEAAQVRLDAKKHLETLRLGWRKERLTSLELYLFGTGDRRWSTYDGETYTLRTLEEGVLGDLQPAEDEAVLEGLKPAYSIRELAIHNYGGVRSPSWLEDPAWVSVSFLENVELTGCKNWEVLPPLGQLRCLKELKIYGMSRVRRIDPSQGGGGGGFEMLVGFPSLESLRFSDMPEWEEWEGPHHHGDDDEEEGQQQQQIEFLPRLHTLEIRGCPKLKELPPLPRSLETLRISNVGLTRLPRLVGYCGGGDAAGRDADHMSLSQLSYLYIDECPNLRSLNDDDGLLQHPLPRLSSLSIVGCTELTSLPDTAFAHFTSLKRLVISNCPKLSSSSSSLPSVSTADEANMPCSLKEVEIIDGGDMVEYLLPASMIPKLTCLSELRVSVGSSSTAQLLLNGILQNQFVTSTLETLDIRRDQHLHQQQHQACSSSSSLIVPPAPPPLPLEMEKVVVEPTNNNLRDHLTSLKSLEIGNCSDLLQLRGLPSSLKRLSISRDTHLDDGILATYLQGLCRLTSLRIVSCPHITSLPTTEVLCHLTALQDLNIRDCEELMSWGGGLHTLIALQELSIKGCPKLLLHLVEASSAAASLSSSAAPTITLSSSPLQVRYGHGNILPPPLMLRMIHMKLRTLDISRSSPQQITMWLRQCSSLQRLRIQSCPQLTCFDGDDDVNRELGVALLNQAPSLLQLYIVDCENLRSLPSKLRSLSSLEVLLIERCPKIQCLPSAGLPESLEYLSSDGCPELGDISHVIQPNTTLQVHRVPIFIRRRRREP